MMRQTTFILTLTLILSALVAGGCAVDTQGAPTTLIGPAGLGTAFAVTATPDILPRDGASISTVRITARDDRGRPLSGQLVRVTADVGTLSADQITTDGNGAATVDFTAPALIQGATSASITIIPVGGDFDSLRAQTVIIALAGPTIQVPTAAFTFSPALPAQFEVISFDASTSTSNGTVCGGLCTYAWNFGDGTTKTGVVESHRYQTQGAFTVTLTVTSSSGVSRTAVRTVTVGAPAAITAAISVSPTNPRFTETVFFDGRGSTAPGGATIASYAWDFGNGVTGTGATASTTYAAPTTTGAVTARTFTVRLTVTDSFGRTGTATATVTVNP